MPHGWAPGPSDQPLPPQNGQVVSPYLQGVLDIRWDHPGLLGGNTAYQVVGVNVYRSDTSDRGPYIRLNEFPVGGAFYRDTTDNTFVRELVDWNTAWVFKGDGPNDRRWLFKTKNPIVKKSTSPVAFANAPTDVILSIDGVMVPVEAVFGSTGDVRLINLPAFNEATEKNLPAAIPTASSSVEVCYYTNRNQVRLGMKSVLFYRLATVALDSTTPSGYRETDLSYCPPLTNIAVETLDYIWKEAMRRNSWILQQGGERVKVFIRRQSGIPCDCKLDPRTREFGGQPSNRCSVCYGTGWVRGYEGPFETIIAPDDAERRFSQTPWGRRQEHTYEVWTGPSPLVTQRDFIVKQTNERYSIGPARRPTNRGNLLQQHFNILSFDDQDIRYQVPIDGTDLLPWPETRYSLRVPPPMAVDGALQGPSWMNDPAEPQYPVGPDAQTPMETNNPDWPAEKQPRGRTPAWANQNTK